MKVTRMKLRTFKNKNYELFCLLMNVFLKIPWLDNQIRSKCVVKQGTWLTNRKAIPDRIGCLFHYE